MTIRDGYKRHPHAYAGIFLLVLSLIFFWDSWLLGRLPFMRDFFFYVFPGNQFSGSAFLEGQFPLWNSYSRFGQPITISSLFYPPYWLLFLLPAQLAVKLFLSIHLFFCSFGLYLLARRWKLDYFPALLISISFTYSTYMIAQMEFPIMVTCAWTPWVLLSLQIIIDRASDQGSLQSDWIARNLHFAVLFAVAMAIQFFTGYPQIFLYTLILCAILMFANILTSRTRNSVPSAAIIALVAGILALGIIMVQYITTADLIKYSIRGDNFGPEMNKASFPPSHFISLLSPYFFGMPGYPDRWFGGKSLFEFWIATCYIGIIPLIMISCIWLTPHTKTVNDVASDGSSTKRRIVLWFSLIMLIFAFVMALGKYTPVYELLFNNIPVFNKFRWPSKFLFFVALGLSILAGLGYQTLSDSLSVPGIRRIFWQFWGWISVAVILVALSFLFDRMTGTTHFFFPDYAPSSIAKHLPLVHHELLLSSAFIFTGAVLLLIFGRYYHSYPATMNLIVITAVFLNLFYVSKQIHGWMSGEIYSVLS